VDDERRTVDRIAASVDWEKLGIETPAKAYDADEARRLLSDGGADIMLCDIEMPGESGLELIAWTRERLTSLETVILTCHADFQYAREAIRLGSFDYLIKPVSPADLTDVLTRLVERIDREHSLRARSEYEQHWLRNRPLVVERFWLDLIGGAIRPDAHSIKLSIADRGIALEADAPVLPVLLRIHCWADEPSLRERRMREHEARNRLGGELSEAGETDIVRMEREGILAVVRIRCGDKAAIGACYAACDRFAEDFSRAGKCALGCYIGEPVELPRLPDMVRRLRTLAADNVSCETAVTGLRPTDRPDRGFEAPDLDTWKLLLENGAVGPLADAVSEHLKLRERNGRLNALSLKLLRQDFLQMVHIVLGNRGVSAHRLLQEGRCEEGELTVPDTLKWIRSLAETVAETCCAPREASTEARDLVADSLRYIKQSLAEDLSRESIAERIGLNPDYFGRVFRKETGLTVTEYIVKERMAMALKLLEDTDQPISTVAMQVGYTNFAYFSQLFRRTTGFTPGDYRKRHRQGPAKGLPR
jgi:two-component system response regulator YesN